ncbi:hypothetical protein [Streptomyces sp. 6N223]|uniref:hypothetical protein n=1 Tax=Streptomyces sp. 6N223 TaxID=3457412 RepID=UPI003FD61DA1
MRVARAAVFAALCVTLSAGAQVLLSGAPLPFATVAVVGVAVFLLALALAGHGPRRFAHIAAVLVPLHLAADTVFTTGQSSCYGPGGGPVTGPLRIMGVDLMCSGGDLGSPLTESLQHPAAPWLLLAAHLVAGLLAAAWLACGEAALARLIRAAVATAFRPLLVAVAALRPNAAATAVTVPGRARRASERRPGPALPLLFHSVVRRGPPTRPALAS